jgi:hypothetical protein
MNTYKFISANACRICTCKLLYLNSFRINTYEKRGEGEDGGPGAENVRVVVSRFKVRGALQ